MAASLASTITNHGRFPYGIFSDEFLILIYTETRAAELHHGQAGQAAQGSLWPSDGHGGGRND